MSETGRDQRFQLAAGAARRIVAQSLEHVRDVTSKLPSWIAAASASTPYGVDLAEAEAGRHFLAFKQRIDHVESTSNALLSHMEGLHILLQHDTFYPTPAIPITRAIAEVSSSASWILRPSLNRDERAVRAYAALFRSIESTAPASPGLSASLRERLIEQLKPSGVRVLRRSDKKGRLTDDVAQVFVSRAQAKTNFQYSQRIAEEIPSIAGKYSGMSGVAHGELLHLSTTWDTPDTHARLIGRVTHQSVEAWSSAVHGWVGVEFTSFVHPGDLSDLIRSMPPEHLAEFSQGASS